MRYYITPFTGESRTIETERPIEDLIKDSTNGFISLKSEGIIGIDFLKNCIIKPLKERASNVTDVFH